MKAALKTGKEILLKLPYKMFGYCQGFLSTSKHSIYRVFIHFFSIALCPVFLSV